jgi:hypothetical protein
MQVLWQVGCGGRDERWIIGDSAVDGSGSGEVKKEKGAGSLRRESKMGA